MLKINDNTVGAANPLKLIPCVHVCRPHMRYQTAALRRCEEKLENYRIPQPVVTFFSLYRCSLSTFILCNEWFTNGDLHVAVAFVSDS